VQNLNERLVNSPESTPKVVIMDNQEVGATVESLLERIGHLVAERQALRLALAAADELERNRLAIAAAQWTLSHALIERHRPRQQAA
jgi:hypothetical protein